MAGADHVSINSKVTINKLQKINYKGESRYEYLRKVWFTCQMINFPRRLSPPLKRDSWQSTLYSTTFSSSIPNIPLFASGVLLTKYIRFNTTDLMTKYPSSYATSLVTHSRKICVTRWSLTSCSLTRTVNFTKNRQSMTAYSLLHLLLLRIPYLTALKRH